MTQGLNLQEQIQQLTQQTAQDFYAQSVGSLKSQIQNYRQQLEQYTEQLPEGDARAQIEEMTDYYVELEGSLDQAAQTQGIQDQVNEAAESTQQKITEFAQGAAQQAQDAAGQATDQAQQVAGQATDQAGQAAGQVQDTVGGLTGGQQQGGVTDQVGQVAQGVQDTAGQATQQGRSCRTGAGHGRAGGRTGSRRGGSGRPARPAGSPARPTGGAAGGRRSAAGSHACRAAEGPGARRGPLPGAGLRGAGPHHREGRHRRFEPVVELNRANRGKEKSWTTKSRARPKKPGAP